MTCPESGGSNVSVMSSIAIHAQAGMLHAGLRRREQEHGAASTDCSKDRRRGAGLMLAISAFGTGRSLVGSDALAQIVHRQSEICPRTAREKDDVRAVIQRSDLHVSVLHAGAAAADVERVLGPPSVAIELDSSKSGNTELIYDEPLRTRVVLTRGIVTEITLDLAHFDPKPLPGRARVLKPKMVRGGVVALLGRPDRDNQWTESGLKIEQMLFSALDEPEFSVILADDLVVDVRLGRERPSGISCMVLPASLPDASIESGLKIGMSTAQASSLFGPPAETITSSFKGQRIEYVTYQGRDGATLISLTFTGGVLTAFKIWPPDAS
jgi:hypothetical protein